MFGGVWVLGSLLAVSRDCFMGFVKILKFSCISPEDDTSWLNIFTSPAGSIACARAAFLSSGVACLVSKRSSSCGLNCVDKSCICRPPSLKHHFGVCHPFLRELAHGGRTQ